MGLPSSPNNRKEVYLSNIAGQGTALPSEPITREEEYLDFIAKNGGGGGTGEGDMKKSVYDSDLGVASAGGIKAYTTSAISGKADSSTVNAILDGTDIDSFGDVESALADKVSKSNTAGLLKNDGTVDTSTYLTSVPRAGEDTIGGIKVGGQYDHYFELDNITSRLTPTFYTPNSDYAQSGFAYSKDVYDAVTGNTELIADTVGWTNKNEFAVQTPSNQTHGVTATITDDKRVSLTGTADTAHVLSIGDFTCKANVKYILSGCPSGGGTESSNYWLDAYIVSTSTIVNKDAGSGCEISFNADTTVRIRIRIPNGLNTAGMVFSPMIRKAGILDSTFEPYRGTTAFPRDEQRVLGAKNLLENQIENATKGTITITHNVDGTITLSAGTSPSSASAPVVKESVSLKKGKYILSSGVTNSDIYLRVKIGSDYVNCVDKQIAFELDADTSVKSSVYIKKDITLSDPITFKPMIRFASDTDDTYVPYAMTNRELTNAISLKTIQVDTANWATDTTSQSGVTLYKKTVSVNDVYKNCPDVSIGASSGLPSTAEQTAYDLLKYVTVDSAVPCLYLYATAVPSNSFYINVEGVD